MKPAIAKKWIKALRSGKYEQTTLRLRDKNGFCCLGVLCDLYPKNKWEKIESSNIQTSLGELTSLPFDIEEWAGMKSRTGIYGGKRGLVQYNDGFDGKQLSFKQIANIIERNVDKL